MNKRISFPPFIALALLVLVTLGCGAPSQATAIPQTEKIAAPKTVPTSTPAPTLTPVPMPDLSTARISLDDLPEGFEEVPLDQEDLDTGDTDDNEFQPEAVFVYINKESLQMIFGMNFHLTNPIDRIGFRTAMREPEMTLTEFAAMWGEDIREETLLEGLEHVGNEQIAMTMKADMQDVPVRMDVTMFERDLVGGMLISISPEGETAQISLKDLGELFDQRIQETLGSTE